MNKNDKPPLPQEVIEKLELTILGQPFLYIDENGKNSIRYRPFQHLTPAIREDGIDIVQ